jgi:hypothetical protein
LNRIRDDRLSAARHEVQHVGPDARLAVETPLERGKDGERDE